MIKISKTVFETPKTIPDMVETIVIQGMLDENNFRLKEDSIKLTHDQVDWINEFIHPTNRVVHLKGDRMTGRTSFGVGMALTTALFQDNSSSIVMALTEEMSHHHMIKTLNYLRIFCELFSLPELITVKRRNEIMLVNGSRIFFERKSERALIGRRFDNLFIDFCLPRMEDLNDEFLSHALPSLTPSGKLIVSLGE